VRGVSSAAVQGRRVITGLATAAAAAATAALVASALAGPPPNPVGVEDDKFTPATSSQLLGSSTNWDWDDDVTNKHNVREDSKLFYSHALTDDPGANFSAVIASGTYHYYCESHGSKNPDLPNNMDGVVKVKPQMVPTVKDQFRVDFGNTGAGNVRWDVQYRVGKGRFKSWLKNTTSTFSIFGEGDNPVDVKPGKTYSIRARTESVGNDERRSGWSPALKVTVPLPCMKTGPGGCR
jgi:plastocyanin